MNVLGAPVHPLKLPGLLDRVSAAARARSRLTVMYLNAHVANLAAGDAALRGALRRADLVYCDGAGVRLGARLLGHRLPPRMTGADILWDLSARAAADGIRVFWLGGRPGVAAAALERLRQAHPALQVAGARDGYFSRDAAGSAAVLDEIAAARADLVLVGLGSPIQEVWVDRHRDAIAAPVVWTVGAAADFIAGELPRAPRWMRRVGLEWLHRLAVEPRRLAGRYLAGNPRFLLRVARQRLSGGAPACDDD